MNDVHIKDEHKKRFVAFGGKGRINLGDRSQADLRVLAIMAIKAKDKLLLSFFKEPLPSLEELQKNSTEVQIAKGPVKHIQSDADRKIVTRSTES